MSKKNPNKIKNGSPVATIIIYIVLAILAFICIYPLWYVLIISLSSPIHARTLDVYIIPEGLYFGSYTQLFQEKEMWVCYGNTVIYAVTCVVGMLFTSSMMAYPLTCPNLIGKRFWVFFLLVPMYFSGGLIPQYIVATNILHVYNTRWAIIFPGIVSMWYTILVRTYYKSIPEEMRESAKIDGANNYQILWDIYTPNSKPILAVVAIYTLVAEWNSWYAASIYLMKTSLQPLQLYLRRKLILAEKLTSESNQSGQTGDSQELILDQLLSADQLKYTMIVIATVPMLAVYPFAQKYFVKGVMVGSLKG